MVGVCKKHDHLWAALRAVGDMMVSDYHGNSPDATFWFKAVYCKVQVTRRKAVEVLFRELHTLKSQEGNQTISWGAEMTDSNKPPSKSQHQVAKV